MNETQELPAVSKLREAFDTARNAIIEGSALAVLVDELRRSVASLNSEVHLLQRDLEYIRGRNKELDEQVMSVRQARDNALADASEQRQRADVAETDRDRMQRTINSLRDELGGRIEDTEQAKKERDDAMSMALEYESKLKAAEVKLDKIGDVFGINIAHTLTDLPKQEDKPKPHYVDQPRDEVGKFQPTTYDRGSQSEGSGF